MLGPSEGARSGSSWVSMKTAATPMATAARARSVSTKRRSPPLLPPCPPGCCTEWVASNTTGIAGLGQDRQRAHVGHQRVVAEAGAALAQEDPLVAARGDLAGDVLHVPGREELALLDVDRVAGLGRGDQEIGLAAQIGRDLQDIDRLGGRRALLGQMHVGQDRDAARLADLGEDRQPVADADAARTRSEVRFALSNEVL